MSQTQQINFVEIEDLYREFGQPAYNLAFRMLGNSEAAEEAVQAVFLDYWRSPEPVESKEFLGWVLQAVHQKCLGQRGKTVPVKPTAGKHSPQIITQALAALPYEQKELLELAYFTGQDYRQLARNLRKPDGAVKTTLIRGLVQLNRDVSSN